MFLKPKLHDDLQQFIDNVLDEQQALDDSEALTAKSCMTNEETKQAILQKMHNKMDTQLDQNITQLKQMINEHKLQNFLNALSTIIEDSIIEVAAIPKLDVTKFRGRST